MSKKNLVSSSQTSKSLAVAPAQVYRGENALVSSGEKLAHFGKRPLVVGGKQSLGLVRPLLTPIFSKQGLTPLWQTYQPDCCEHSLRVLTDTLGKEQADFIIGVGGGKALDTAKLVAYQNHLPVVTVPTCGATCAAWTALANVYSESGAFLYDVPLASCPDLLILDYTLIARAPQRTLIAGIGDAIAKWYEASVSSGHSSDTLIIAAVQEARILRDLLLQKSLLALENPGSEVWQEVVDASVLLAGVIGGLGGANCRTVAAHAVHNGLTHLPQAHQALHGEKVAYGILVQLRLEEMVQGNQLASTARAQLLKFYEQIGLPQSLEDLGLQQVSLEQWRKIAEIICLPDSDIHRLPFAVSPEIVLAAMVSTTSS